jgi:pimeloyl-ACP methyl ester carboxylesterase
MAPKLSPTAKKTLRTATIFGAGAIASLGAAAIGTAIAARTVTRRDERHADPFHDTPYGTLAGSDARTVLAADGTKLHTVSAGTGRPTLVLTHGFSMHCGTWYHQFDELTDEHRLLAWDVRGHGLSEPSAGDYRLETFADDLACLLDQETDIGEPVVLVGHSMGAMVIAQLLVARPELMTTGKIAGLVFSDTGLGDIIGGLLRFGSPAVRAAVRPFVRFGYDRIATNHLRLDRLRGRGTDLHYAWARLMGFGPQPSHRHVLFVREMLDAVGTDVWVNVLPSIIEMELREHIASFDVPALVLVGSHDRITPHVVAQQLADALPQGRLEVIDRAGHTPMLEKHREWNDALRGFLREL